MGRKEEEKWEKVKNGRKNDDHLVLKCAKYSESCFSLVEGHQWDPVPIPVNTGPI